MDLYDVNTFVAYAVAVFVLVSCFYRKHVRRPRLFFVGIGLFLAAVVLQTLNSLLQPAFPMMTLGAPPPALHFRVLGVLVQWTVCATLPVFFAACCGAGRAFPQCSSCGYDLTGSTSGTCSECGKTLTGG